MTRIAASVLLAESVRLAKQNTEINVERVFDNFTAAGFPANAGFWVLGKVWGIESENEVEASYRVVRVEDDQVVGESPPHRWRPRSREQVHTAIHQFEQLSFPTEGVYQVQLVLGTDVIGHFPLLMRAARSTPVH